MELLPMIAAERRDLADLITSLSPEQLATRSLCGSWTVHEVAAHLVTPFATRPAAMIPVLLRSGFRLHAANARLARLIARRPPAELAALLRANAENRFSAPIVGHEGQLTDLQVHGQDIRRPLGLPYTPHPDRLRATLDFLVSRRSIAFGRRSRLRGLRFEASDLGWSSGTGPAVRGTGEALMLALTGRRIVLPELTGDGATVLRDRLSH
ncbi:maleylpyruvate isomerase family mycothiol-dependent enzyme [Micromonospora sp. BQ11]|uniref:maleylpyruvate isomerase family mycothiol-dependent enzyme n=1 Tax=Micromonospora sp. BQ11 TaxID=3452212 RepID=UPI003F89BC75